MSGSKNREGAGRPKAAGSDRDREIERLTEVFKDAILHAPIPDVNPNPIRTVESQARECALRVVGVRAEALREAAKILGHRDCPQDPDRDPYIGCVCRVSLLYARADRIEGVL
jgi:hypothetical protein